MLKKTRKIIYHEKDLYVIPYKIASFKSFELASKKTFYLVIKDFKIIYIALSRKALKKFLNIKELP